MVARSLIAAVAALMISAVSAFSASGVCIGSLSCLVAVVDAMAGDH